MLSCPDPTACYETAKARMRFGYRRTRRSNNHRRQEAVHLQKLPYLVFPGPVVAGYLAGFAAWWIDRPSWIVPAIIFWFFIGVICAWIVLRKYGLPVNGTFGDVRRAIQNEKNARGP
jgi:hypothetical protein